MCGRKNHIFFALLLLCLAAPNISLAFFGDKALVKDSYFEVELKFYPSPSSEVLVKMDGGEAVKVINRLENPENLYGSYDHWYFVRYKGLQGWVFGAFIDTTDKRAEGAYIDVPSFLDRTNAMYEEKESEDYEDALSLASGIVRDIEGNFTKEDIKGSRRLTEFISSSLLVEGELYLYLGERESAEVAFRYLLDNYPEAELELESTTAADVVKSFLFFINRYSEGLFFDDASSCLEEVEDALKAKNLKKVSRLVLPGIFEVWVANTDWIVRTGDVELCDQQWLKESWGDKWEIILVDEKKGDDGETTGYCIETGPWGMDYYGITVDQVDFCIDLFPGSGYVLSYLILHTSPNP